MGFELPKHMIEKGVRIITDEEYKELQKINKNFCDDDDECDE